MDILMELDYSGGADFYQFLTTQKQLYERLDRPVDLVSANDLSPFIDREKQLIHEKLGSDKASDSNFITT